MTIILLTSDWSARDWLPVSLPHGGRALAGYQGSTVAKGAAPAQLPFGRRGHRWQHLHLLELLLFPPEMDACIVKIPVSFDIRV